MSQNRYKVFFTDKKDVKFNPYKYFDVKAIDRRLKSNISLYDKKDFPLNENYVLQIENITKVTTKIRWFNLVFVEANTEELEKISQLSFVRKIEPVYLRTKLASESYDTYLSDEDKKLLKKQTQRLGISEFHEAGFKGEGMRIAIFDGGFPNVDKSPIFTHIHKNNRVIKTYDFARKKENVYAHNVHGTMVLSCIAGITDSQPMGLAVNAEFLLARTEINSEPFSEEENWLAAVEWADKNGADIINSSLGYTYHRYNIWEMNGEVSLVAKAANIAASKGILVVNAMGNDGDNEWKVLGTPADADSILSIGGIDPDTDYHQDFSSFGPTADMRMKPNVVAYSTAIVAGKNELKNAQGTSFASPLIAGFVACAWQTEKDKTNMEMFDEIQKSGELYPYFDYAHGFGVPKANYFTENKTKTDTIPTFYFEKKKNNITIKINKDFISKKNKKPEYLYIHIKKDDGVLEKYWLYKVYQEQVCTIDVSDFTGMTIAAHFKGYTELLKIED